MTSLTILLFSRNPDHQIIHFQFVHRTYLTPHKLHRMKILDTCLCSLCPLNKPGTFMHMVWECKPVADFWKQVASAISLLTAKNIPVNPQTLILDNLSSINASLGQRRVILAGLTAAKKLIAVRWKPPHTLDISHWYTTLLDIIYLEISTARIHNAKQKNISFWYAVAEEIKSRLLT